MPRTAIRCRSTSSSWCMRARWRCSTGSGSKLAMRSKFWLRVVLSALLFAAPDVGAAPDQAELSAKFAAANEAYDRQDYARSFALFREVAEQGDAASQFNVGNMYKAGKGVAANDGEAMKWFRLAAAQKVGLAQLALPTQRRRAG